MNTAPSNAPTANETSREIQLADSASVSAAAAVAITPPASDARMIEGSVLMHGRRSVPGRRSRIRRHERHAAGSLLSAIRVESLGVRVRAPRAAVDACHACAREPLPGEAGQIREPFAFAQRLEVHRAGRIARAVRVEDVAADFEAFGPDRRADPRRKLAGRNTERGNGRFEDAGGKAAPSGVRDADDGPLAIAEEHGQAVRGAHRDRRRSAVRVTAASAGRAAARVSVDVDARIAVHLREPDRVRRQRGAQALARHVDRARREERAYARRPLPLRDDETSSRQRGLPSALRASGQFALGSGPSGSHAARRRHIVNAAISASMSAGTGDSHRIDLPGDADARGPGAAHAAPACEGAHLRNGVGGSLATASIGRVADQRMTGSREVHADLVRAPGLEPAPHDRRDRHALEDVDVRARRLAARHHRHRRALRRMTADRRIDRHVARHVAVDDGEVLARDRARGELAHEIRLRLRGLRDDQEAARVLVETMDDARARKRRELPVHDAGARSAACRPGCRCPGCTTRPARLVDDEERVVFVHDVQRDVLRYGIDCVPAVPSSTAIASPPASLWRGVVTTAPSTRTRPASIHARRRVRECSGRSSASAWSRRRPAADSQALAGDERHCRLPLGATL